MKLCFLSQSASRARPRLTLESGAVSSLPPPTHLLVEEDAEEDAVWPGVGHLGNLEHGGAGVQHGDAAPRQHAGEDDGLAQRAVAVLGDGVWEVK